MNDKAKAPFWKPALIYGAILGFVGILVNVVFYFLDLTTASWTGYVSMAIGIVVLAYCLVAYRNEYLGGFASFGQIFVMALVIGIISGILGAVYQYILFAVIDPELIDKVKLVAEERIMNNPRIPESMYEDIFERMEKRMTSGRMVRMALILGVVGNAILGLIIAAFVKKSDDSLESVV